VVEVAVVGRPDPMLDEAPVAFVIAANPGDELRARIAAACALAREMAAGAWRNGMS